MPTTLAAIGVLLFLLPGFVSDRIIAALTPPKKRSDVAVIIDALVFAFVDYVLYRLVGSLVDLPAVPIPISDNHPETFLGGSARGILVIFVISVTSGIVWSSIRNSGAVYAALGRIRVTRASGRVDVWQDVFNRFRGYWFQVWLKDGTRITGWPDYYSDDGEKREIFLRDAIVERDGAPDYMLTGPGVLLTERAEIERIEILPKNPKDEGLG